MTSEYRVEGMTCSHCVAAVTAELSTIEGVTDVQVQLDGGVVTVDSAAELDLAAVAAAVEEAGYTLVAG
jgi:copper chaperone CopZ